MARCKYPNEVCTNMTVLKGVAYCDVTPCQLKDDLPHKTNADRLRAMTDDELATELYRRGIGYTLDEVKQWLQGTDNDD